MKILPLIVIVILSSFLISCSSNPLTDFVKSNLYINSIQRIIYGYPDFPITRELVESIPYASLRLKIGKGPAGLMILQKKEDGIYSWVSKDKVLLQIKGGRIVRTSGLNNDLIDYYYSDDLLLKDLLSENSVVLENKKRDRLFSFVKFNRFPKKNEPKGYLSSRSISLSNPAVRALEVQTTTEGLGMETIKILDREYETYLIKETVYNKKIKWRHENFFWIDPVEGKVRKSIQQIAPNVPPILIEITKAPTN